MPTVRSPPRTRKKNPKKRQEDETSQDLAPPTAGALVSTSLESTTVSTPSVVTNEPRSPPAEEEGAVGGFPTDSEDRGKLKQGHVGKLGDDQFKLWGGSLSRSSSDTGSESATCKGGPGKMMCGEVVKEGERGVACDICGHWYHAKCQAVSRATFQSLNDDEMLAFFCAECKLGISKRNRQEQSQPCQCQSLASKINQLENLVRKNTELIQKSLNVQEESAAKQAQLPELTTKAAEDAFATHQPSYAAVVQGSCAKVMETVTAKLDAIPKQVQAKPSVNNAQEIAGVFDNFLDKEKRKLNVVVHNIPESAGNSVKEKADKDANQFKVMVQDEFKLNVQVTKAFRVGKSDPDKPRLLVVALENVDTKLDILKQASELRHSNEWRNVYITPDLTWQEREEGRKLRGELARRRDEGERNLVIRRGKIVVLEPRHQESARGPQTGGAAEVAAPLPAALDIDMPLRDHSGALVATATGIVVGDGGHSSTVTDGADMDTGNLGASGGSVAQNPQQN